MGTRNITRVVSNNELKVCQYCQWDGYPTGAGRAIAGFIRESDDERMVERLTHVTLSMPKEGDLVFATGAPYDDLMKEIAESVWDVQREAVRKRRNLPYDYEAELELASKMMVERFGEEAMLRYKVSSRDTGCEILDVVYGTDCDLELWTDDYLRNNSGDWQIEAIWELDYDRHTLHGNWHGLERTWTFAEIREMTDEQVKEAMSAFEAADEEDE